MLSFYLRRAWKSLRRTPVLLGEALDFFEASDDTLLTGWACIILLRRCKFGQLCRQIVKIEVTHSAPRL